MYKQILRRSKMRMLKSKKLWRVAAVACLLCVGYMLTAFTAFAQETGTCGNGLTYVLSDDGVLTISGEGYIYDYAFHDYKSIIKLVIEDGVTSIGEYAFYGCSSLESIEIPDSVTSIGYEAFDGCSSLESIEIPSGVTSIEESAFYGCSSLESIIVDENNPVYDSRENCNAIIESETNEIIVGCKNTVIPDSVTNIGKYAFGGCSSLESIEIPDSVTSIGWGAFSGCSSLESIEIPSGVTSIGDYAFRGCTNLTDVYYSGSQAEWNQIDINVSNGCLTNATIHYGKLSTPAVTTVTTSAGINVKWTAVDDAESYIVYRKTSGGTYSVIKTITNPATLNYVDTTPVSGTVYYYTVRAAATGKTKSDYVSSAAVKYLAPSAVTAITNTSSGVKITWKTVTGASGYHVYRKSGSGSYSLIKTVSGVSSSTYTDTTAVSGTSYTYAVRAAYGKYEGSYTAVKTTKFLGAVTVSSISNVSTGLQIKWSKVTGATGYKIYRKVGSNSFAYIKTVSGASTVSYIDTTAVNGTTYKYTVRAVYGSYLGSYTNCKTLTRVAPTAFTGAKNSAAGSLSLTWSKNAKASGYLIQYSTSSSFSTYTNVRVTSASTVAKTISSLTKGKTYYVRIRAYQTVDGSNVYSTWSAVKSVKITQ